MRRLYFLLLLSSLVISCAAGQPGVNLPADTVLRTLMQKHKVPALGVGVIENNEVTNAKVLGGLKQGVPAPVNSFFQVASLTKPIVEMTTLRCKPPSCPM